MLNTYGVTEGTVYQTIHETSAWEGEGGGEGGAYVQVVGRAMRGVVLEVEGDTAKSGGVVGEVLIGGVQVQLCLWLLLHGCARHAHYASYVYLWWLVARMVCRFVCRWCR